MHIVWHRGAQWADQGRLRQDQTAPSGAAPGIQTAQWCFLPPGTLRWEGQTAPSGEVLETGQVYYPTYRPRRR